MTNEPQVTPEQLAQERSIRFALLADLGVLALFVPVGLLGGSLTIKAEAIRFVLGMSIEIFAYTVMWRLHRGKLHDLEYGGGKLEQIANLVTGLGMLAGAAWIASKAMEIVSGHAAVGTPLGLALAAIVGAKDEEDILDRDDQGERPDDERQHAQHVGTRDPGPARCIQGLAEGVDRARPDVAIDDAQRAEHQRRQSGDVVVGSCGPRVENWLPRSRAVCHFEDPSITMGSASTPRRRVWHQALR